LSLITKFLNKDIVTVITCILLIGLGYILGRNTLPEDELIRIFTVLGTVISVIIAFQALNMWRYAERAKIRAQFAAKVYPEFFKTKAYIDRYLPVLSNLYWHAGPPDEVNGTIGGLYMSLFSHVFKLHEHLKLFEPEAILMGSDFYERYKSLEVTINKLPHHVDNALEEKHISNIEHLHGKIIRIEKLLCQVSSFD
jgi:hypothetical protein